MTSRLTVVAVAAGVVALAVPAAADAFRDPIATIQAPTRCDAAPGERVTIRFRVTTAAADGTRTPFGASGIFVVLRRVGHAPVKRYAHGSRGRYVVRTAWPRGGVRRIDTGVDGTSSSPGTGESRPAPALFRTTGDPCRLAR
jgi:hypothetical protein